jgi:hypothetical protein
MPSCAAAVGGLLLSLLVLVPNTALQDAVTRLTTGNCTEHT